MKVIIVLLLLGLSLSVSSSNKLFQSWKSQYQKTYQDSLEEAKRFFIFERNVALIEEMNAHRVGGEDVQFGLNQFSDMSQDEFKQRVLMDDMTPPTFPPERHLPTPNVEAPGSFDWRDHGAVTEVKDQGTVGTCWTFSTTGNIEGVLQVNTGRRVSLAEEQLVDCDGTQDPPKQRANCGVFGGWPYLAFEYIIKNGGIDPTVDYPYCVGGGKFENSCFPCMAEGFTEELCGPPVWYCDPVKWPCKKERSPDAVKISNWAAISSNEEEIAQQLVSVGPLSIGLNASMLQFYKKGVFDPLVCKASVINHAVLLVGYGATTKGELYWTVKNSWGKSWGEDGYFRIARGKEKCGINSLVSTAIL